jgi:non-specific serine/threonine protein kinase
LFREVGDRWAVGQLLNNQACVAADLADYEQARQLLHESLAIRRQLGDRWTIANSLNNLGLVLHDQGDHAGARTLYEESLAIARELGDKWAIAFLLEAFAGLAAVEGEHERALRLGGAAEALRLAIGSPLSPADQATLDAQLKPARQALSTEAQESAWIAGSAMTLEGAVAYATTRG